MSIGVIPAGKNADSNGMSKHWNRGGERNLCAELIHILWADDTGIQRRQLASLEDISPGGACIQVEHPIPVDTPISIFYPDGRYRGRIRYCIYQDTGYFVGVQFDPGHVWSKEQYMPSHLLELHSLRRNKTH